MISSLTVSSGLTVSDVQKLFDANTATVTSSASTPTAASPSSADDDASTASDPASVIKAILAAAQINQSPTVTLGGADSGAQFYSEAIGAAYSETLTTSPGQTIQTTQAYMTASQGGSALAVTAGNGVDTDTVGGLAFTTSLSFSSVSAAADDDSASIDNFQETVTLGDDSVTVGFSVAGLGPLTVQNNEIVGGAGSLQDFFQVDVSVDDHTVGLSFNVGGLNSDQANALGAAFEAATSAPASAMANSSNSREYTQNYGNGFSADITDVIGY